MIHNIVKGPTTNDLSATDLITALFTTD